jgi:hypothetical protein
MRYANAIQVNRKSGGAQPRDLQFRGPFLEMFFRQSIACWSDLRFAFISNPRRLTKNRRVFSR